MDSNKIIEKTSELAKAITESDVFIEYKRLQKELLKDESFQKALTQFLKVKESYEEASKYGKYHPDLSKVMKEYQTVKIELMSHEGFKRFKQIERELELFIFQIEKQLKDIVGIKDKHNKSALKFMV